MAPVFDSGELRDITLPGEVILDPFGGSFTTAIAAIKENRKCISFEKSEHYFKLGERFLFENMQQNELF